MPRFSYYDRLPAAHQAIYRASDAVRAVRELDAARAAALAPRIDALRDALASDDPRAVTRAAGALVRGLTDALGVEPVDVTVHPQRPRDDDGSELHGYYTREDGTTATIEVWMRTAANARVVSFRTFVRTLLHEVCHHLDFTLYGWTETFHTEGFFARESSLTRALLGDAPPRAKAQLALPLGEAPEPPRAKRRR